MARWIVASRDGDMQGGDFPAWLATLLGRELTTGLSDTRGECIYSACEHYGRCFIERTVRRARTASLVVANHALVMIQAALGGGEEGVLPTRYVFDEGHHLFDAADGAFSAALTGREAAELRRWLLGAEGRRGSRARGLKSRLGDVIGDDEAALEALDEALRAARALPGPGWQQRIGDGLPVGAAESFLALVRKQVYARDPANDSPYGLECVVDPPVEGLLEAAKGLNDALLRLARPLSTLKGLLRERLDTEAATLEETQRRRIDALARGIDRRGVIGLQAWRDMLGALGTTTPEAFVDWFAVERADGRDLDVGFHRHWVDPTRPFVESVATPAHGILVTSASLRDGSGDGEADWLAAEARTGARHLTLPAERALVPSPFDYPALTRVFVVTDVGRTDMDQIASAYRELFLAAGGGGLGLFTAIARLRAVHKRIAGPLDDKDIMLLAQHVDPLDVGTLIDIFRAEEDACLLGTDAVRDGVDVPGRSLRLIVFDRVPWPRPDILHKARRQAFGGKAYEEMLTRFRLKQAFGRLVRRHDDRGVFVMLDRSLPSRLLGAFPEGVPVKRIGLAEVIAETKAFLAP
jgi:ATP-dependent DNA helicase DinG